MKNIILGKKKADKTEESIRIDERINDNIRREDTHKRTAFAKHFKNEDGTYTMELSSEPIHYFDEATKQYEEIDNTLIDDEKSLRLTKNDFKLEFAKEIDNHQVLRLNKGNKSVSLKYHGKKERNHQRVFNKSRGRARNEERLNNAIVYEEVAPNVDLEYIISHNKVKENIVIKAQQETYEFSFELNVGDYKVQLSEDSENIELVDNKGQVQFIIPSPIMIDGAGEMSSEVTYELEDLENGTLTLIVKANANWINADERVLPVKIDPQFINVSLTQSDLEQYQIIDNKVVDIRSSGKLGAQIHLGHLQIARYMFIVNQENLLSREIVSASLELKIGYFNNMPILIGTYEIPDGEKLDIKSFEYDDEKLQIKGYLKSVEKTVCSFASLAKSLVNENNKLKRRTAFVLRFIEYVVTPAPTDILSLSISIQYKVKPAQPNHYLGLGQRTITEVISTLELDMTEIEEVKDGVLTTVVDAVNQKVYQQYLVENNVFTRTSHELSVNKYEWLKWEKMANCATVDTRNQNYGPEHYMKNGTGIVTEFKSSVVLKSDDMKVGWYGILTTYVPWKDESGGLPMQEYRSGGVVLTRQTCKVNNEYHWTNWIKTPSTLVVEDRRDENYLPSHYMKNGASIVNEFKSSEVLKNEHLGVGWYGILTTYVPWEDESGGLPMQEFRSNGVLLTRRCHKINNEYQWTSWSKSGIKIELAGDTLFITDNGSNPKGD